MYVRARVGHAPLRAGGLEDDWGEEPDLFCPFLIVANVLVDAIRRHVVDAVNDDAAEVVNEVWLVEMDFQNFRVFVIRL